MSTLRRLLNSLKGRFRSYVAHGYCGPLSELGILALLLCGCVTGKPVPNDWKEWQAKRMLSIGGTNGWTTLVGLHWLEEGTNSAGSDPTNHAVLPVGRASGFIGNFTRHESSVKFTAAPGVTARVAGQQVAQMELVTDATNAPTRLEIGLLTITAIQRGDRIGLRVRDPESPARQNFRGLKWFPYDPAWRLDGRFLPFPVARTLKVADVTGCTQEYSSPGQIEFKVHGGSYRLDVVIEPDETDYFVIFRDQTAAKATYDAGRFLYAAPPDAMGRVIIDFNRAYTPPCGFTRYATCPMPPRQNWLPIPISAGELKPSTHPE